MRGAGGAADETYRRRIVRQLNKGENLHALRRPLGYAGEGWLRRRRHEQEINRRHRRQARPARHRRQFTLPLPRADRDRVRPSRGGAGGPIPGHRASGRS
ncbi:Tn3 family transposase [Solwaraspora sp. WMMA2056]|nr:Tn3 family transposase [Solwaraspora sp. WMMA2056]WJK43802.1 Tn3 family transposase [Solwaraspora sp. WMMA2056]